MLVMLTVMAGQAVLKYRSSVAVILGVDRCELQKK